MRAWFGGVPGWFRGIVYRREAHPACCLKRAFAEAGEAFFAELERHSLASLVRPR